MNGPFSRGSILSPWVYAGVALEGTIDMYNIMVTRFNFGEVIYLLGLLTSLECASLRPCNYNILSSRHPAPPDQTEVKQMKLKHTMRDRAISV